MTSTDWQPHVNRGPIDPPHDRPAPIPEAFEIADLRRVIAHWRSAMRNPGTEPEFIEALARLRKLEAQRPTDPEGLLRYEGKWVPLSAIVLGGLFRAQEGWSGMRRDQHRNGMILCCNRNGGTELWAEETALCLPIAWQEKLTP